MNLTDLVEQAHGLLDQLGIAHAFGGALALGYRSTPRGTGDVDINVFVPFDDGPRVVTAFERLGFRPESDPQDWTPLAGVRLVQEDGWALLDLFFSVDPAYEQVARRSTMEPFGPARILIPVLSAEDLIVFKLSFGRTKDWVDLQTLAEARDDLDLDLIEDVLIALRGPTYYPRVARFRKMVRAANEAQ